MLDPRAAKPAPADAHDALAVGLATRWLLQDKGGVFFCLVLHD